jgi:hypothetical protein
MRAAALPRLMAIALLGLQCGWAPVTSALDAPLADAAARHLGGGGAPPVLLSAPPWSAAVRLRRSLAGKGFHRTLGVRLEADAPRGVGGAAAAAAASGCRAALVQPLPSGLFADPYQLGDLERTGAGARFTLLGPLDLEL